MKDPTIVMSNVECIKILTELGILDKLYPEPPYTRAHVFFEYRDCHCVAAYDKGHDNDKDNGYSIIMIPYAMMPVEQSHLLLEEIMDGTQTEPGRCFKYINLGMDLQ